MNKIGVVLRWQPIWVLALSLYSGLLLHGFQWRLHSLFWDHRNIFPAFAEHYHALNRFGELQWWSHNDSGGVPAYYLNILAHNFLTPLSIVSSSIWWTLGRAGVFVTDWLPYYCLYHMMFVPTVFLAGFYCFLCQIVRQPSARLFGLMLAAFGPAAVAGVYGLGIEQAGYAFFFVAMWMRYARRRRSIDVLLLNASAAGLLISMNHLFLFWSILFVPLMLCAFQWFETDPARRPAQVIRSLSRGEIVLLGTTIVISTAPALLVYMNGTEWLRSIAGSRVYNFEFLRAGNPLQLLATIVPGVGFQWGPNDKDLMILGGFGLTNHFHAASNFFQYGYLGPLCGALAVLGVLGGLTAKGRMILLTVSVGVLVVMLSGFSPIFAPLLVLPSPLRSVNHYSDVAFTIGFSTLLICLGAQGYVVLGKAGPKARRLFLVLLVSLVAIAVVAFVSVYGARWREEWIFGFFLVSSLAMVLVLARAQRRGYMLGSTILLLGLLFVDISTNAFWWVRHVAAPIAFKQGRQDFTPSPESEQRPAGDYSSALLVHRAVLEAETRYGTGLRALPRMALATSVRPFTQDSQSSVTELLANGIIEISPEDLRTPLVAAFTTKPSDVDLANRVRVARATNTYNSITVVAVSDRPAILFCKILYNSPWLVLIDGKPASTVRAFGTYLGVLIPPGQSEIAFLCAPTFLKMALGISVLWFGIMIGVPLFMGCRDHTHPALESTKVHGGSTSWTR
jgi:hypothetical protein